MTIFAVTRGRVENGSLLGFLKLTEEQVLGCQAVEPGFYHLVHGYVDMDVVVDPDDSVSVATDSIMSGRTARALKFGESTLKLPVSQDGIQLDGIQLSIIPKWTKAALTIGPDSDGISLSLERHANESVAPVAIGTLAIESALKPARSKEERSATFGGGRGSG